MDYAELEGLGDEIAEMSAHLEAATARLLDRIREFDERQGWNNGFRNCAAWLSWRVSLDPGAARERVRVARALGSLPLIAGALARGEISYAKARAVTRVATPETEERLLAIARNGTASHVEAIVRGWRRMDRKLECDEAKRQHLHRGLYVYEQEDGTVVVRGRLTAEAGAVLLRALEAGREKLYPHRGPDVSAETPTYPQQRADALALVAETALHHELDSGAPGERYVVTVHVDAPVLKDAEERGQSVLEDGGRVSAETSQRMACDASRVVMRHDDAGRIIEIGARTRTIPPVLRRALQHRDQGCRFPGCGVRVAEGHHIHHWSQGGPTTLSNLALLCRRHHRAVHEEGFKVERTEQGLVFTNPYGWPIPDVPPAPQVPDEPMTAVRESNKGLSLDAQTLRPNWTGERLDVGYAIDVLHPLAQRSRPDGLAQP